MARTIHIELFTAPHCRRCGRVRALIREVLETQGDERIVAREVNVLDDIDHAARLGVLATPAIAIDGRLVFTGVPSRTVLLALIERKAKRRPRRLP